MVGDNRVMLAVGDLSTGHKRACFKNPSGGASVGSILLILPQHFPLHLILL
jgi:hypothetical protein